VIEEAWWFEGFAVEQRRCLDTDRKKWSLEWLWSDLGESMRWRAAEQEQRRRAWVERELGA
jgi:hypothetical protein